MQGPSESFDILRKSSYSFLECESARSQFCHGEAEHEEGNDEETDLRGGEEEEEEG